MSQFLTRAKRTAQSFTTKTTETTKAPLSVPSSSLMSFMSLMSYPHTPAVALPSGEQSGTFGRVACSGDGRRVWVRAMGELLDWPRLSIGEAQAVTEGRPAWTLFTTHPDNSELVDRAVTVLLAIDTQGLGQS
jgi:hypothetical protein